MISSNARSSMWRDGKFLFIMVPPLAIRRVVPLGCIAVISHPVALCPLYLHPPSDEMYRLLLLSMKLLNCRCVHLKLFCVSNTVLQHRSADLLNSRYLHSIGSDQSNGSCLLLLSIVSMLLVMMLARL